jgi:uncharacterized repeat protein (TIGR03803 family)
MASKRDPAWPFASLRRLLFHSQSSRHVTDRRKGVIASGLLAVTAAAALVFVAPARTQSAHQDIAFVSVRDGNREIYVMNADGSGVTNLTNNPSQDDNPAWSPDGTRIAFDSDRSGSTEIFLMNADGSGATSLTSDYSIDTGPAWSPDGARIAFASNRDGNSQIYVIGTDGTGLTRLTAVAASDSSPSWSPDGQQIAFRSDRASPGTGQIYAMSADGTNVRQITFGTGDSSGPRWSLDGKRIVFSTRVGLTAGLYVINADGSALASVTPGNVVDTAPAWSPDGTRVAFSSNQNGAQGICVAAVDSGVTTCLTQNGDTHPSWALIPPQTSVGMFAGRVTDVSTSAALAGIQLLVYDVNGAFAASMATTADGSYASPLLPPGTYFLRTFNNQAYIDELYDDVVCLSDCALGNARAITVFAGGTARVDVSLQKGLAIAGHVRDASTGVPVGGASVDVFDDAGNFISSSWTSQAGAYMSTGLPAGSYFARTSNDRGYPEMLYNAITCIAKRCDVRAGTRISMDSSALPSDVDFALELGGQVTGVVRDVRGAPLPKVRVQLFSAAGAFVATATTDGSGTYATAALPPGSYRSRTSNQLGYIDAVFGGRECVSTCDLTTGSLIAVTAGATTSGSDFRLELGGTVTGRVRIAPALNPLSGVQVDLYSADGLSVARAITTADGGYRLKGLPPSTYFARTSNVAGYQDAIYNGVPCAVSSCNLLSGTPIVLLEGGLRSDVDFTLDNRVVTTMVVAAAGGAYNSAATLSASLMAAGAPVVNRTVTFTVNGVAAGSAVTTAAGVATLERVPLGTTGVQRYGGGVAAVFSGDASYGPTAGTGDLLVTAAMPRLTWPSPSTISYGTPLSPLQLNASADVPGTVVFQPPLNTVLPVGAAQTLTATFLPDDAANYVSVSGSVPITVLPAAPATQPTFQVLHHFTGADGSNPNSVLTSVGDGSFFGTTSSGGAMNTGVLYRVSPDGAVATVYTFGSGTNAIPSGVSKGTDGLFYGTTSGSAYRADSNGTVVRLRGFTGSSGASPSGALVQATDGNFYGVATYGGQAGLGTIYRLDAASRLTAIHSLSWTEGAYPVAGLVQGRDGFLYGVTVYGGSNGMGTVFRTNTSGSLTVLHSFSWSEGANPQGLLAQGSDGNLYGTTSSGGPGSAGSIFRIDAQGNTSLLHAFAGADGAAPLTGVIQASDGFFYGTTSGGGRLGAGTAYRMDASGRVTTLHEFMWADGANPIANLREADAGTLYGTANFGGANGVGSLFRMTRDAGSRPSQLQLRAGGATYGGATDLSFAIGSDGVPLAGELVSYAVDGNPAGVAITGIDGAATVRQVSVSGLRAGSHRVDATFLGDALSAGATASSDLVIAPAVPGVVWQPMDLTYGTALGPAQLNASASVKGAFSYSPRAGTLIPAGVQLLSVVFTPADATNYTVATAARTIAVNKLRPQIVWPFPQAIAAGTPLDASQLNAVADVPGTFEYSPGAGTILPAGLGNSLTVTFTPANADQYAEQTATVVLDVEVPVQIAGDGHITWEQPPGNGDTANLRFALYVDGTRTQPEASSCVASNDVGMLTCGANLASIAQGTHRLELASFSLQDTPLAESGRSRPLFVTVTPPVQSEH